MKIIYNSLLHERKMKPIIITSLLLLGTVDAVEGEIAVVEITDSDHKILTTTLPTSIFPCPISEGDMFHFEYSNGVTEIRCGDPE
tara:strand:- start:31 stop:285 length:255 start_codon:yes stop_codon:yes gene_type:complete